MSGRNRPTLLDQLQFLRQGMTGRLNLEPRSTQVTSLWIARRESRKQRAPSAVRRKRFVSVLPVWLPMVSESAVPWIEKRAGGFGAVAAKEAWTTMGGAVDPVPGTP